MKLDFWYFKTREDLIYFVNFRQVEECYRKENIQIVYETGADMPWGLFYWRE